MARGRAGPRPPDERRLYGDLAWTWPIISPPEDYVQEADQVVRAVRRHARIPVRTLLDLGCGGGHNDHALRRHLRVTGVDVSPAMLRLARRLNPRVEYRRGDMRTVRLGRTFDAVLIADSIDYMLTERDLRAAFRTAFAHLRPGGVLVTYAEFTPVTFRQHATTWAHGSADGVDVGFIESRFDPDPRDTWFESTFIFVIRRGGGLRVEVDRHRTGLFPIPTWRRALREAGFRVVRETMRGGPGEPAVPMFVGVREV